MPDTLTIGLLGQHESANTNTSICGLCSTVYQLSVDEDKSEVRGVNNRGRLSGREG